ncbi:MAG: hypothetical protein L3K05_01870 [Thermoplasmata archaeon]|nr:hypothetical protein [Thermoplasmata archaeon]
MNLTELLLGLVALVMAVPTAYLVRLTVEARTRVQAWVTLFLLAMMGEMWVGAIVYARTPSESSAVGALAATGALMAATVALLFVALIRSRASRPASASDRFAGPHALSAWYRALAVAIVLASEGMMAYAFLVATATPTIVGGLGGSAGLVASVVVSPWFVFPMGLEMGIATALLWSRLSAPLRAILPAQAAIMLLTPTAIGSAAWLTASIALGSVGMIAVIVYVMEHIYRHREIPSALGTYLLRILAAYALMMAGLLLWLVDHTPVWLAASIVVEMVVYFWAVLAPEGFRSDERFAWQLRADWTFGLLAAIFVGELFMGAVLDLVLLPGVYGSAFPSLPLAGGAGTILYDALYNAFWFLVVVTGSTWFLAMMGAEMGVLVLLKLRETVSKENKVRLALVMGSYAAFATFFPSYYYSALFPKAPAGTAVPVLGWSMGFGSAPVVPSFFLVIFLTYLIVGSLTILFGRRVVCGVFCTAALMYGGTTFDAMSSFNRTSPSARKYLGSRFSNLYSATTGVTMAALVAVSFLSYFDATGRISVSVLGADPSVFFFSLSFGVLWFLIFVTIPYTGNYNCVTMGWCYTGTIAGAIGRVGLFKLKVRDKGVCKSCTTLDCAKACPVGLVDMPGHFRTKGEFRSSKCCGIGNCVGACPYGNLYVSDVRHWVRRRLGVDDPKNDDVPLPMVHTRPRGSPGSAPSVHAATIVPPRQGAVGRA